MIGDKSSLANPDQVKVTHLDWNVSVDFDRNVLTGSASLSIEVVNSKTKTLVLDTSTLKINKVQDQDGHTLAYKLGSLRKAHLGQPLSITLQDTTAAVSVFYETSPSSSAIQWLPPSQTAGKKHPYLYTQCQAIHARALLPCQDQPGVKFTYSAKVTVPSWATAVLSAIRKDNKKEVISNGSDHHTYSYAQNVPIPSYLVALAVGDLERREISPRSAVWSEPAVVEAAAWEFAQTEDFLSTAETLAGMPYGWGRYDLLCLPPSSPYGGMENCSLVFLTPTLLAGDRSLADVVAHEIAHSWTGNCVTNATWDHFWLNEGWTTWFQRKIMGRIHDNPKFIDLDALGGHDTLEETVREMPTKFTSLVLDIGDSDPDNAYSSIAYEKGFQLLWAIEKKVGTDRMEAFFQAYLQTFSFQTLTSEDFQKFCSEYFSNVQAIQDMDWQTWLYGPGMPPEDPGFDTTLSSNSTRLADAWLQKDRGDATSKEGIVTSLKDWKCLQITYFLDALTSSTLNEPLKATTCHQMDEYYEFSKSKNAEILFRYCRLALSAGLKSIEPVVVRFITSQGRMKFTRPLYRALYEQNPGLARDTFLQYRDTYHPICTKMVAADLSENKENRVWAAGKWLIVWAAVVAGVAVVMTRRKR